MTGIWTPPTSVSPGHIETAAELNAMIGADGNLDFLHESKFCRVYKNAVQSLTSASATVITFQAEDEDLFGLHSTATNTGRITIPTGLDGVWLFHAVLEFASNATGLRSISLRRNGATTIAGPRPRTAISGDVTSVEIEASAIMAATDYMECRGTQDSGGALNVDAGTELTYFEAWWVGSAT